MVVLSRVVLDMLQAHGCMKAREIAALLGVEVERVSNILYYLKRRGLVKLVDHRLWCIASHDKSIS